MKKYQISFLKKNNRFLVLIVLFLIVSIFVNNLNDASFWNIFPIKFYCEVNKLFNIQKMPSVVKYYNNWKNKSYNDTFDNLNNQISSLKTQIDNLNTTSNNNSFTNINSAHIKEKKIITEVKKEDTFYIPWS